MLILAEEAHKRSVQSLYSDLPTILPPLNVGEAIPFSISLVERVASPTTAALFTLETITNWTFRIALINSINSVTANLTTADSATQFSGFLNLDVEEAEEMLDGEESTQCTLAIRGTPPSGLPRVVWSQDVILRESAFGSSTAPTPNTAYITGHNVEHSLTINDAGPITVDISGLALTATPSEVMIFGPVSKTASGQDNIYASFIEGSATATQFQFTLNAPCDATGRKVYAIVNP
jgi:hypothetical protein